MSETNDNFLDGKDAEWEKFQLEVKDAIVDEFRGEDWFAACGVWRDGVLITLPFLDHGYHYYFRRSFDRLKSDLATLDLGKIDIEFIQDYILRRVVNLLNLRFEQSESEDIGRSEQYERRTVSRLRPRPAWRFHRVIRGKMIADVFFSFDYSVGYRNTTMGIGGSAILSANSMPGTVATIVNLNNSEEEVLLTNKHVLQKCVYNDQVYDLMNIPPHLIGYYLDGVRSNISFCDQDYFVDAAIARKSSNVTASLGNVISIGQVRGSVRATREMEVQKYGKTTGHTYGEVEQTGYEPMLCDPPGQKNLIRVVSGNAFQMTGDSGSLLVDMKSHAVGLLFAMGDDPSVAVASHWDAVADALNISI